MLFRSIEQMVRGILSLNQGTIYPALLRLEQQGLIKSAWGTSENNRRAKFYEITRAGEKHRHKAFEVGATEYLVKPYQDETLLGVIRQLMPPAGRVMAA